jgi:multidrug efflux pump subunit AcrA (membrane-fusion protein)
MVSLDDTRFKSSKTAPASAVYWNELALDSVDVASGKEQPMRIPLSFLMVLVITAAIGGLARSAQPRQQTRVPKPPEKPAAAASKPATHKVERGPFKVEVSLKGTFEAEEATEVRLSPQAWIPAMGAAPMTVLHAVEHGTPVKKGDVLVEIDPERIDHTINDLKSESAIAQAAIQQAEKELPILEKDLPLELAAAERTKRVADEDLDRFLKVDRAVTEESAKRSVEMAEHWLQTSQEELKQLEKMYRSKDLTEETEEFILKRTRFEVRMAEFFVKTAHIRAEETLKLDLPRREKALHDNAAKAEVALEKAVSTLPLALQQRRLGLQKMKYDYAKNSDRLTRLEKDRETLTVRAPTNGIVYHGKCIHGQWSTDTGSKLQRGGMIAPEEVFITLVKPRPMFIRAAVEEKELHFLKPQMKGKVVVAGYPDLKPTAQLARVSTIPESAGKFQARVNVHFPSAADADVVMPGMACTVNFVGYQKKNALTLPSSAVFTDEGDDDEHHVYVHTAAGKDEKRTVKIGKASGSKTEILEGVQEGDEILTTKPEKK